MANKAPQNGKQRLLTSHGLENPVGYATFAPGHLEFIKSQRAASRLRTDAKSLSLGLATFCTHLWDGLPENKKATATIGP